MPPDMPHRRFDPLRGRWVLVSAGRVSRPWKGETEAPPSAAVPRYDPGCYLCPGNERAHGQRNPDYTGVHVFTNDFPALRPEYPDHTAHPDHAGHSDHAANADHSGRLDAFAGRGVVPTSVITAIPASASNQAPEGELAPVGNQVPEGNLAPEGELAPVGNQIPESNLAPEGNPAPVGERASAGQPHPLLRAEAEAGTCRVLCYSPRHDESLATMPVPAVRAVVDLWADQVRDLERDWRWVQVFENRGTAMGASSPHPHGQVWASASLPDEPAAEDARQRAYYDRHGQPLLADYAAVEEEAGERVVAVEGGWLAVVPFWAVWPFETLVLPRHPVASLPDVTDSARDDLAVLLRRLLTAYDALFDHPFPYSMGWHGAPSRPSSSLFPSSPAGEEIGGANGGGGRAEGGDGRTGCTADTVDTGCAGCAGCAGCTADTADTADTGCAGGAGGADWRRQDELVGDVGDVGAGVGHGGQYWQVHAHFYPPLLRSPTVRKFLVGYEMLAGVQRDITPEVAAVRLRAGIPPG